MAWGGQVAGSKFQADTAAIAAHANRTAQRAEEVQSSAESVRSTSLSGEALGALGGSTVENVNAMHQRAGSALSGMSNRLQQAATTENGNATDYDTAEATNTKRFTDLLGQQPSPTGGGVPGGAVGPVAASDPVVGDVGPLPVRCARSRRTRSVPICGN